MDLFKILFQNLSQVGTKFITAPNQILRRWCQKYLYIKTKQYQSFMSVFICKSCNSMLYNLPASKIFIWLLPINYFFAISVIASNSNLRHFWAALQVYVMIQPPLEIFTINSWQGLWIMSVKSCLPEYPVWLFHAKLWACCSPPWKSVWCTWLPSPKSHPQRGLEKTMSPSWSHPL